MHPHAPRSHRARTLACAAVAAPVLLLTGCSSGGGPDQQATDGPSPTASAGAEAVKFEKLPDPCGTVGEKTVEDLVPGARSTKGKGLTSSDTNSYGACLWSGGHGKNDADYRALTVSLKRYDSDASLGSGDEQAERYFGQEVEASGRAEDGKAPSAQPVEGVGTRASGIAWTTEKEDEEYRVHRVVVLVDNVVATVDHEGAGFGDADLPGAADLKKDAEKAAKEVVSALG
jgi:hypothetical protein